MLTILSPAKTLDFDTPPVTRKTSIPDFLDQTETLVSRLQKQTPDKLSALMGISRKLAELNVNRYRSWTRDTGNARQALLAFRGDVYLGLDVDSWGQRDFTFAQKNLRILSGLYGLLRPLDLIHPHRLEMGTKLRIARAGNLYEFWGDTMTLALGNELERHRNQTLVNLASNEYFRSIQPDTLPGPVITPVFKDYSRGSYKVLGFYAKKARGSMAAWIVRNRINSPAPLRKFDVDGYRFDENLSSDREWVFTRKP